MRKIKIQISDNDLIYSREFVEDTGWEEQNNDTSSEMLWTAVHFMKIIYGEQLVWKNIKQFAESLQVLEDGTIID